jgi:hypothetical protein
MAKYKTLINNKTIDMMYTELSNGIVCSASSWNEAKLLLYFISQKNGFNISTETIQSKTKLTASKISANRKKLENKGFLTVTDDSYIINYDIIETYIVEFYNDKMSKTDNKKCPSRTEKMSKTDNKNVQVGQKKCPKRTFETLKTPEAVGVQDTDIDINIDIDINNNIDNQFLLKNFSKEELIEYIISLVSATAKTNISFTERQKDYYQNITQYIESGIINYDLPYDKEQMFCITKNINAALKTDISYHDYYILTAIVFNHVKNIGRAMRIAAMIVVDYNKHSNLTDGIINNLFYKDCRLLNNTLQTLSPLE